MKPFQKSIKETISGILGALLIISAFGYLLTGLSSFFLILVLVAYLIIPLYAVADDFWSKRVAFNIKNLILLPVYYLFSSWHEILFIFLILPGIAISLIMGPFAAIIGFVGASGLFMALLQFIFDNRFGLSELRDIEYLKWFGGSFLVGGFFSYLTFVRDFDLGERMSSNLNNMYEKALRFIGRQISDSFFDGQSEEQISDKKNK